jgi:hypothetical protein
VRGLQGMSYVERVYSAFCIGSTVAGGLCTACACLSLRLVSCHRTRRLKLVIMGQLSQCSD